MIKIEEVRYSPGGKISSVRVSVDGYKEFLFVALKDGRIRQISSSPISKEKWKIMFRRVVAVFHSTDARERIEIEEDQLFLNL